MDIPLSTSPAKNLAFDGRDWQTIKVAEVVDPAETRFVELDTTVEQASKVNLPVLSCVKLSSCIPTECSSYWSLAALRM